MQRTRQPAPPTRERLHRFPAEGSEKRDGAGANRSMASSYSDHPGERARNRGAGLRIDRGSCAVQGEVTVGGRNQIPQVRAARLGHQAQGGLAAVRTAVAAWPLFQPCNPASDLVGLETCTGVYDLVVSCWLLVVSERADAVGKAANRRHGGANVKNAKIDHQKETRLFASRSRCEKPLGRSASPREGGT